MSGLLPVAEALEPILATALAVTDTVELPLIESLGHVLASDYHSAINVPGADNSAIGQTALDNDRAHAILSNQIRRFLRIQ